MSREPQESDSSATFNTLVFAGLLGLGAIAGGAMAGHVVPGNHIVAVLGTLTLPLGVILGLSFGQKCSPPTAVLNILAVFEGRHTLDEVIQRSGATGGMGSIGVGVIAGSVVTAVAIVGLIDVWLKPGVAFIEMVKWFGVSGLVFGVLAVLLLAFLTE